MRWSIKALVTFHYLIKMASFTLIIFGILSYNRAVYAFILKIYLPDTTFLTFRVLKYLVARTSYTLIVNGILATSALNDFAINVDWIIRHVSANTIYNYLPFLTFNPLFLLYYLGFWLLLLHDLGCWLLQLLLDSSNIYFFTVLLNFAKLYRLYSGCIFRA